LYEALASAYGVQLTEAVETIETVLADPKDARLLGVDAGMPLLLLSRQAFDVSAEPVEWAQSKYRGDRYKLVTGFAAPTSSAGFAGPAGSAGFACPASSAASPAAAVGNGGSRQPPGPRQQPARCGLDGVARQERGESSEIAAEALRCRLSASQVTERRT